MSLKRFNYQKRTFVHSLCMTITVHYAQHSTVLIPVAVAASSPVYPRFPPDGTTRPEWPVPAPASPQTHVTPFDIPDGRGPALWPYWLHSAKQQVGDITGKMGYIHSISQEQWTFVILWCYNKSPWLMTSIVWNWTAKLHVNIIYEQQKFK